MTQSSKNRFNLVYLLSFILIFSAILVYSIGTLFYIPYAGFVFDKQTGGKIQVFDPNQMDVFQPEDQITAINHLTLEEYRQNLNANFWDPPLRGKNFEIEILRQGEPKIVEWEFTGKTDEEFNHRFLSFWPLGVGFCILSLGYFLGLEKDHPLRKLMSIERLLLGFWIILNSGSAENHLWASPYLSTILGWMVVPMLLHIHWRFPISFNQMPEWVERVFFPVFYVLCGIGMFVDLLYPEISLHTGALAVIWMASFILLFVHYIIQEKSRPHLQIVVRFSVIAILPTIAIVLLNGFNLGLDNHANFTIYFAYLLIPTGYLFALWHGSHTLHSKRASRFLAAYILLVIIIFVSLSVVDIIEISRETISITDLISMMVMIGLISSLGFDAFHRQIKNNVIGIPVELPQILDSYTDILLKTQDTASISSLMGSLILPALRIRQSVLVEFQSEQVIRVLDLQGILEGQLPNADELNYLVKLKKTILPPRDLKFIIPVKRWIRVILPLRFDQELIGVWLLGRRDPNDYYEEPIVNALETIAQQTTIAIINHHKSTHLRSLYEANINRNELERANLARELHDDTLNNLALLQREFNDPQLTNSIHGIIKSLRKTIQGLRPEMLSYGLITALQDLADILNERQERSRVLVEIQGEPIALNRTTELHIFRIIQQACENALAHAEAKTIRIEGKISKDTIQLQVLDDGIGMGSQLPLNLKTLIQKEHYGLAGMYERANIINAKLNVESQPGKGTIVFLNWPKQS